jgi:hypothetical protein
MGPRAKAKKKNVLSTTEIAGLKDEQKDAEDALKDASSFGAGTPGDQIDKAKIQAEIGRLKEEIHLGSPGKVTAKSKDSMHREEKELEDQFQKGMPTRYEMDHPGKCPGAVRKHMSWLNNNQNTGYVKRYQQIQRTLRPGEERSVETLRKDR